MSSPANVQNKAATGGHQHSATLTATPTEVGGCSDTRATETTDMYVRFLSVIERSPVCRRRR